MAERGVAVQAASLGDPELRRHHEALCASDGPRWRSIVELIETLAERKGTSVFGAFTAHDSLCVHRRSDHGGIRVCVTPLDGGRFEVADVHHASGPSDRRTCTAAELADVVLARLASRPT